MYHKRKREPEPEPVSEVDMEMAALSSTLLLERESPKIQYGTSK